ncbi:hypothetical protein MWK25_27125, partial [Escherichia coli]|uniref:hypothetical protein n=1 Tax=Escherichia coli TaxID=562 RepID=UPI00201EE6F8
QATFKLSKQMRQTRQYIRDQNIKVVKKSDLEFEIIVQGYHENVGYHSGKAKEKVQKVLKNVMSLD